MTHARSDYEHGDSLDWRDHVGLAHSVAYKAQPLLRAYNLSPQDVIPGLESRIVHCLEGRRADGSRLFDPDRGLRPSTYLTTVLKRHLLKEIAIVHGYGSFEAMNSRKWRTKSIGGDDLLAVTMVSDDPPVDAGLIAREEAEDRLADLEWIADNACLTREEATVLYLKMRGFTINRIASEMGCSHWKPWHMYRCAIRKMKESAERLGMTMEDLA